MKKVILSFALILNIILISAQNQCLTTAPAPPQWIFNKSAKSLLLASPIYTMNIFVHIVRSSSGQGLGTAILPTILSSLNSNFQSADIQFSLAGSEFIDNDYYYTNLNGRESQLFSVNPRCNAIDIYVLGQSTTWNGAGLAENIPSTALIVHGNYYNTSSLPHEMGHCLGLYHTHHGTVNEGGGDTNQCAELVNESNSATCGDYISDTPADPNQWSSSSCTYVGTGVDANGDSYNPDASNLMSYAYKPCRNSHSVLQNSRMRDFIVNTAILRNTFTPNIFGPSTVCTSGTSFTLNNIPPSDSIVWTCGPNLSISSGQNTGSCNLSVTGNGSSWVRVRLVTMCGNITLPQKNVWVGPPTLQVTGPDYQCPGDDGLQYYASGDGATSYLWEIEDGEIQIIGANDQQMCALYFYPNYLDGELYVTASNECGTVDQYYMMYWDPRCDNNWYYSFSPNPANTTLTIERFTAPETVNRKVLKPTQINKASTKVQKNDNSYTIEIWHEKKGKVKTLESVEKKLEIDVSTLEKGNYFLHIITPTTIYKEQLLIQ